MAAPATQGKLCTRLQDMEIGDYIQWHYKADSANVAGEFTDISSGGGEYEGLNLAELPTTPGSTANGSFYFLKVDKGLLVADRRIQAGISASGLNAKNYLYGKAAGQVLIRILTVNEWVKYITNGNCNGSISVRDTKVWNIPASHTTYANIGTGSYTNYTELTQGITGSSVRTEFSMVRSTYDGSNFFRYYDAHPNHSSYVSVHAGFTNTANPYSRSTVNAPYLNLYICFRPAMEYIDNPNSKNIWY